MPRSRPGLHPANPRRRRWCGRVLPCPCRGLKPHRRSAVVSNSSFESSGHRCIWQRVATTMSTISFGILCGVVTECAPSASRWLLELLATESPLSATASVSFPYPALHDQKINIRSAYPLQSSLVVTFSAASTSVSMNPKGSTCSGSSHSLQDLACHLSRLAGQVTALVRVPVRGLVGKETHPYETLLARRPGRLPHPPSKHRKPRVHPILQPPRPKTLLSA